MNNLAASSLSDDQLGCLYYSEPLVALQDAVLPVLAVLTGLEIELGAQAL